MAVGAKTKSTRGGDAAGYGLRVLAVMLGVFFIFMGLNKIAWLTDGSILAQRFQDILKTASPGTRWYIETIAIPGTPLFARLVPLAELSAGVALIVGFWIRLAAAMAFVMVLNFHFAIDSFSHYEFLRDGTGPPVLGGLLALVLGGGSRLPWAVSR
jgi:uncharacterized membrane protein YphA (DoxX/SURF4 family)